MRIIHWWLWSVAVIWWWAAWLMSVASIIEHYYWESVAGLSRKDTKPSVYLFEKNPRLWAKVIISWWWRCNVTTGTFKRKELLENYPRWTELLDTVFRSFGPKKVQQWFEDHGVPLKQEADGRIFPQSDNGHDVVWVFEKLFDAYDQCVTVLYKYGVDSLTAPTADSPWYRVVSNQCVYLVEYVLIATWWQAFRHTWSDWDWYTFAQALWHTITQLWPSLNSFLTKERWLHDCSGISLPNAYLNFAPAHELWQIPKKYAWPVLLTHFWITWPHVFIVASLSAFTSIDEHHPLCLHLCLDVSKDQSWRDRFLIESSLAHPKKLLLSIISQHLPKRLIEALFVEYGINKLLSMSELSKHDRKKIAWVLWWWICLHCIKRRPWDEFVTAWWVPITEVNHHTMESNILQKLFFSWEILDVDWFTGWYNLQASRASGWVAGKTIADKIGMSNIW